MITCSDCVRELKTARLSDIRAGSPVALHYASCENCSRLVHDLYYSERSLAAALDTFGPDASSPVVAEKATDAMYRRRKKIARGVRVLLALAGLIVAGIGIAVITDDGSSWQGEIIELKCLSGAEASRIAEGFMTSGGNIRLEANERTIVLEGAMPEVVEAASQIAVADAADKCAIGPGGTGTTTPPSGKSGTD
jgi:hypothetical protein